MHFESQYECNKKKGVKKGAIGLRQCSGYCRHEQ